MKPRPIICVWTDDEVMKPLARFMPLCIRQFAVGAEYPLQVVEPRSMKAHNFYFASLHEIWNNLPEAEAERFRTAEHLRAWALVHAGFFTKKDYVCDSASKARHLAKIIRAHSEYAVIKVSGDIVQVFDPKSQSIAAMGNDEFKESKKRVLDIASALIPGLDRKELSKAAAQRAPVEKERKPDAPKAPAPALPTSAPAYFAFARSWIMAAKTREEAYARWDGERELRDRLRVSIPNREELAKLITLQFAKEDAR